jgi:outer membrane protein assembly factor BamB
MESSSLKHIFTLPARASVWVVLCMIVVLAFSAVSATASTGATETLNPTTGLPGSKTTVAGSGFAALEIVNITFDSALLAHPKTKADGTFSAKITVPATAQPGSHTVTSTGKTSKLSASQTFTVNTDWSMFGFDPTHAGFNPYENTLNASNVSTLTEAWMEDTGIWGNPCWTPVVVDGVIYGGGQAWSTADGTPLWSDAMPVYCSHPAVVNGVVYVGAYDNNVYALNAADGSIKWKTPTGDYIASSPAVVKNVVYVGSHDGNVYAFSALTGKRKWKTSVGAAIRFSSPAVAGGVVYIGSQNGNLYALNAATGKAIWTGSGLASYDTSPVVVDGIVYSETGNGALYAVNVTDGSVKWSQPGIDGNAISDCNPVIANGVVYASSVDGSVGPLNAYNATDGTLIWQSPTNVLPSYLAVANGVVYGNGAWGFYAFSATDGSVLYHVGDLFGGAAGNFAVVNGTIYGMWSNGEAYVEAYQLPTP